MRRYWKGFAAALSVMLLVSLCLTPVVFATETTVLPSQAGDFQPASSSDGEKEETSDGEVEEPSDGSMEDLDIGTATASNALNINAVQADIDGVELLDDRILPDTAFDETGLLAWLEEHGSLGGTLLLSSDVTLSGDLNLERYFGPSIVIDTQEYTITVAGNAVILDNNLTITGQGGDSGVIRVAEGASLCLDYMIVEASDGFAVWQEEGSGFLKGDSVIRGSMHCAETAFIWNWDRITAIVEPGQAAADAMPAAVTAKVNENGGRMQRMEVPIAAWDLTGHEEAEERRLRFTAQGEWADGYTVFSQPVCTVVYNDHPLTFTEVETGQNSKGYEVKGNFTKPEILPVTIMAQYSFDGEDWQDYTQINVQSYTGFFIWVGRGECSSDYLYIRLYWKDGEADRYSNVLRFSLEDFDSAEDIGGNRGGGTSITPPTDKPEPSPDPELPGEPEPAPDPELPGEPETLPGSDMPGGPEISPDPELPGGAGLSSGLDLSCGDEDSSSQDHVNSGGTKKPGYISGGNIIPSQETAISEDISLEVPFKRAEEDLSVSQSNTSRPSESVPGNEGKNPTEENKRDKAGGKESGSEAGSKNSDRPVFTSDNSGEISSSALPNLPGDPSLSAASGSPNETSSKEVSKPVSKAASKGPDALAAAAGCLAVMISFGAAGICLHPKLLKNMINTLKRFMGRR